METTAAPPAPAGVVAAVPVAIVVAADDGLRARAPECSREGVARWRKAAAEEGIGAEAAAADNQQQQGGNTVQQ